MQQGPGAVPPAHPVDRGWAWMVCLGAFGLNFFVNGGLRSMGILFIALVQQYKADESLTSLTVSVLAGGFAIFSAVGNAVGAVKTMRAAGLFGAVMMFLGMFLTYFAPNIYVVIVCLGFLSGIGYGFSFGPSMVMVSQYFVKRRSLANGLAAAGGSCGTLLIPFFIRMSMDHYGFRGTILIYSAIILNAIPAAMLLRPVAFYSSKARIQALRQPPPPIPLKELPSITQQVDVVKRDQDHLSDKAKKGGFRYELVGSRVISVPPRSLENLNAEIEPPPVKASPPQPPQPPPPGPPPKVTIGLVIKMFFQKLCDKELFLIWPYLAYVAGLSVGHGGYITNCMFLPAYGYEIWHDKAKASNMIIILGVADLVGRVSGGWFADLNLVRKPFIIGFSFVVSGLATIAFPFFPSTPVVIVYIVILGLLGGTYMAQMVVIVAELVGPIKTPSGLGLATMIMGLTIIPLLPALAAVAKVTGTYSSALRLAGLLLIAGGILFYLIPCLRSLQDKKTAAAAAAQKQ